VFRTFVASSNKPLERVIHNFVKKDFILWVCFGDFLVLFFFFFQIYRNVFTFRQFDSLQNGTKVNGMYLTIAREGLNLRLIALFLSFENLQIS